MEERAEPRSAFGKADGEAARRATLAVIVDNEPGVLARVVGLFAARGYNIDSLTVAALDQAARQSRITVVTRAGEAMLDQIKAQLLRLVPVSEVIDIRASEDGLVRELALVKVAGTGEPRVEALRIAQLFRARAVDTGTDSFIFELTGTAGKIDQFIALMKPLGLAEVSRTGALSIRRGR